MAHNSKRAVDLRLGGCSSVALAHEFGTPLLVIDEAVLRSGMRRFCDAFSRPGWRCEICYAGKALLLAAVARTAHDEGLFLDVCSLGELRTALGAGVPAARCVLHGCYKITEELDAAIEQRVGLIVIDHLEEIEALTERIRRESRASPTPTSVLLRVNPGIAAHTHGRVQTGAPSSKFGFAICDGQALSAVKHVALQAGLSLSGIHCHVGSQIRDLNTYAVEVEQLVAFAADVKRECGIELEVFNIGGGLATSDLGGDAPTPEAWAAAVFASLEPRLARAGLKRPTLMIEPGRSLIGPAGTTIYRIGVRKRLPDGKQALIADGCMSDNPRPALYDATYPVTLASRPDASPDGTYTIFGRHCETDILFSDVLLANPRPGDLLAVSGTGAYTYAMASNYNRFSRPAVVFARDGRARLVARRESLEHLLALDVTEEPVQILESS